MENKSSRLLLICSMCIFSTVGILRKYIPFPSSFIALTRGFIGCAFLCVVLMLRKEKPDFDAIKKNALRLVLSGATLGFNWIFLFESYNHTTVAIATLCYYLAPVIVVLVSPVLLKEKLTPAKLLCTLTALVGMVLVSGATSSDGAGMKGIFLGLCAAVLYASVILLNKKLTGIGPFDRTTAQLLLAALVLLPYVLATENLRTVLFTPLPVILLAVAGIVHTGIAYWLYFGSMEALPGQTVALYSYLDPILAIVLSMVILGEPMTFHAAIGAVLILGAAFFSER